MPRHSRFASTSTNEALARSEALFGSDLVFGPLLRIDFPTAGAVRQVAHGLEVRPDGFLVARATGAVYQVQWTDWTADVALLQAPAAHTLVVGRFFTWASPEEERPV